MTYLKGILAWQPMLAGLGVGRAEATAHSAILYWIVQDAARLLAGLVLGLPAFASLFKTNVRFWRMASEVARSVSGMLMLLTTVAPAWFLVSIVLAAVTDAFANMAGGCTRMVLMQHFARRSNYTDCFVKEGNQVGR